MGACGVLAFAVGCGDDSSTTGSGSASEMSDRRTAPKVDIDPTDQARAKAMMVTLADVGPGWIQVADRDGDLGGAFCGDDPNGVTVTGDSPNTHDTVGLEEPFLFAASSIRVYATEEDARRSYDSLAPAITGCLARILVGDDPDVTIDEPVVAMIGLTGHGDEQLARGMTMHAEWDDGTSGEITLDLVVFRQDRAIAVVTCGGILAKFPRVEEERILANVEARGDPATAT